MIHMSEAVGHFSRVMGEIIKAEGFVSVDSLSRERVELTKRLPEDAFRRVRILHAVLRRGLAAEFASQKAAALIPKPERVPGTSGRIIQPVGAVEQSAATIH